MSLKAHDSPPTPTPPPKKKKTKKKTLFLIQERFNIMIYGINTIIKCGTW